MCQRLIVASCWLAAAALVVIAQNTCWSATPEDWLPGSQDYDYRKDTAVKHAGEASGLMQSTADMPTQAGVYSQRVRADDYRGKRIRLSGFLKSDSVDGWGGLWMRIDTADKFGVAYGHTEKQGLKGATDWIEQDLVLDVPPDAAAIWLGGTLVGKGKLWGR